LRVRHFGYDRGQNFLDVLHAGYIALPRIQFGRDSEISGFAETPAQILDVLVHAKDLLHDENYGKRTAAGRHRAISRKSHRL
jgi:hypothetical protein